jgi:hypothetical protein
MFVRDIGMEHRRIKRLYVLKTYMKCYVGDIHEMSKRGKRDKRKKEKIKGEKKEEGIKGD